NAGVNHAVALHLQGEVAPRPQSGRVQREPLVVLLQGQLWRPRWDPPQDGNAGGEWPWLAHERDGSALARPASHVAFALQGLQMIRDALPGRELAGVRDLCKRRGVGPLLP